MKRFVLTATIAVLALVPSTAQAAGGDIYTYDPVGPDNTPRVLRIDPSSGAQSIVSQGGLFDPVQGYGLVRERSGTLVLANGLNGNLVRIDPATGQQTPFSPGMVQPRSIAVDTNGDLYVTDAGAGAIFKVDPVSGSRTPLVNGIANARGITIGNDGNLYFINDLQSVQRVSKSGGAAVPVSSNGDFANIQDIIAAPDGNLYVDNFLDQKVIRLTLAGAQSPAATGPPLDTLNALGLDANGKLLVSDQAAFGSAAIFRIDGVAATVSKGGLLQDPRGMVAVPITPDPGGNPDTSISATISAKKTQRLKSKVVAVAASCPQETCTVNAGGNVSVPKTSKSYKLKTVSKSLKAGEKATIKLKLSKKLLKAARKAVKRGKKVNANLTVTATDAAKNATTQKLKVRLKR